MKCREYIIMKNIFTEFKVIMASNFLLYLERKKLYQAVLCIGTTNFRIKLIPSFYDLETSHWFQTEDIINLPLYIWPALFNYIPEIDQLATAIEDKSICFHSNLGTL